MQIIVDSYLHIYFSIKISLNQVNILIIMIDKKLFEIFINLFMLIKSKIVKYFMM